MKKLLLPWLLCAASFLPLDAQEEITGLWQSATTTLGVTPRIRYFAEGTFTTSLITSGGKEYPVCSGSYVFDGKIVTETVFAVEKSFYGWFSSIKANSTVLHMELQTDGKLLSLDVPVGGQSRFYRME
jgi:hypothetical protein